ncbi:MAG: PAS domain S-box protein [Coleofasciculus sp. Co-bin14]|nr:PAS domain S-box protein [Coleofasciculus sp. Co-bin14]
MSKPTIVCVDDDIIVLHSLENQLICHFGNEYDIEIAESGEEALEIFAELTTAELEIPVIICDQIMPGMKGDQLLAQIHAQYPKTLKILLTGQASAEAVGNAVNTASLYRFIAKPWDKADLCLTITQALRRYAQDKQLAEQTDALKKINQELERLNDSLEQTVAERTAELAKAEAELRGFFAAMTELILVFDAQGRHLKIASNNSDLLYKPNDERIGKTLHEVFKKEQADTFLGYIQKALKTQQTVNVEYSLMLGDRRVWSSASISPISADSVLWVARDITESKLLEEKLRASERRIRAIFEAMSDIVLVIDEQGGINVAPTNPDRLYNCDTDPIGATIEQFFGEGRGELWFSKVRHVLDTQQTVNFDYSLPIGDREVWFAASISPIPDHSVLWVARNIDERKQAEEALRIAEQKYHSIVENAIEGIFQSTPSGQFLSANLALAKICGYNSPDDLINNLQDIGRQLYVEPNRRLEFITALDANNKVFGFESLVYRRDRETIWISENARAVRNSQGTLLYYEGTISDITERKLIQEALKFQQEETDRLLLNILPAPIVKQLQQGQSMIAERFEEVSVLFADIVGFTEFFSNKTPEELVKVLNIIFSKFDQLAQRYGLEKIKTIGDAYMVVAGLPTPQKDHAVAVAQMALDMQAEMVKVNTQLGEAFKIRVGINTGPVVAGVIGLTKFIYDLWGDTVNTASRMESGSIPGMIQVTAATYEQLKEQFRFEKRGCIPIKGKGEMMTYFLLSRNPGNKCAKQ